MSRWPSIDLTGQRFGRLVVQRHESGATSSRERRVVCRCDCGTEKAYTLRKIQAGATESCGCLRIDMLKTQPSGRASPLWKGDDIGYGHAHRRVNRTRGKPSLCEHCGTTDAEQTFKWASVSKRYHDPADYIRLCKPCHAKFDDIGRKVATTKRARRSEEAR